MVKPLELENVSFYYKNSRIPAICNINLNFNRGEIVGIVGANGSGKTTLLYICNSLIPREIKGRFSGKIRLFGRDALKMRFQEISSICSLVFQDPNDQIFNLTVEEEVAFALINRNLPLSQARKKARDAISKVGLSDFINHDPSELSLGQKQKVAIASAIAQDSDIMLLDEPVSSLDWKSSCQVYSLLSELARNGKTIIITEQDTGLLLEYATRIIAIDQGKIYADGGKEVLFRKDIEKLGIRIPLFCQSARVFKIRSDHKKVKRFKEINSR